jgi:hypothetical protein
MAKELHNEEVVGDSILELAVQFTNSHRFVSKVESFMNHHAYKFYNTAESKSQAFDDFPLEYTSIFEEYQTIIDNLFGEFASNSGYSIGTLYTSFRDSGYQTSMYYL